MRGTHTLYDVLIILLLFHTSDGWLRDQMVNRREYEVVRPRRLHHRYYRDTKLFRSESPDEVSYRLKMDGKDMEIHLQRNRFLISKDYIETHYTSKGRRITTPYAQDKSQCYYIGKVVGDSQSTASISTCHGLSGYIRAAGQEYVIEPLVGTDTGDHVVVKNSSLHRASLHCGVNNRSAAHQLSSFTIGGRAPTMLSPSDVQKYIEMFLVVDHSEYLRMQQDVDKTRMRMFEIINFVNMVYRPLKTAVVLVGLEIWTDRDQIPVDKDSSMTLHNFREWSNKVLTKIRSYDNAQLVTAVHFRDGILGSAYTGTICTDHSNGVIQDHSRDVAGTGATLAHELGHNLGMVHDGSHCACAGSVCIMTSLLSSVTPRHFSSCSVQSYMSFLERPSVLTCLTANPFHKTLIAVCGNGLLEEGEQCDCGSPEECTNACCDARTCNFTKGAQCDQGECCQDCKFIQFSKLCRAQADECDLPEYCMGTSAYCPEDTFLPNGSPCSHNTGYCLDGRCPIAAEQCRAELGKDTQEAATHCYHSNSSKNAICEMLLCTTGSKDSMSNDTCTDVIPAKSQVLNGTKCDEGKVCMSKECVELGEVYAMNTCKEKCTGHKVCNNKLECQCEAGWIPPNCDKMDDGSLLLSQTHRSGLTKGGLIAIVVVIAVVVLTLMVLVLARAVCLYRNKDKPIHQHRYSSDTPKLGLDNSAFNRQPVYVNTISIDHMQAPPHYPHPCA